MTQTTPDAPATVTTMRAAVARRFGAARGRRDRDVSRSRCPRADEVLVRVHATTVSIADHRLRAKDLPEGLGSSGSSRSASSGRARRSSAWRPPGVVERSAPTSPSFAVGDEVIVDERRRDSAVTPSTSRRARRRSIARKPAGMSHDGCRGPRLRRIHRRVVPRPRRARAGLESARQRRIRRGRQRRGAARRARGRPRDRGHERPQRRTRPLARRRARDRLRRRGLRRPATTGTTSSSSASATRRSRACAASFGPGERCSSSSQISAGCSPARGSRGAAACS